MPGNYTNAKLEFLHLSKVRIYMKIQICHVRPLLREVTTSFVIIAYIYLSKIVPTEKQFFPSEKYIPIGNFKFPTGIQELPIIIHIGYDKN